MAGERFLSVSSRFNTLLGKRLAGIKEPGKPPRFFGSEGFLFDLYTTLKSSVLYEIYLHTFRRDLLASGINEMTFYRRILQPLPPNAIIFDIGANTGYKAEVFRRMKARVYCLEPDRTNSAWLMQRFKRFKNVTVIGKAVSDQVGRLTFNVFEEGSALNTLSPKWLEILEDTGKQRYGLLKHSDSYEVETITLDALISQYGTPFYIKIDVEGHELNVLKGLSESVPFLSFEVNLPEFRQEGLECLALLKALDPAVRFNYVVGYKLEMEHWLDFEEFSAWLAKTDLTYLEIFVRSR